MSVPEMKPSISEEEMGQKLPIHDQLSPLEVMLAVYTPILECLVKHLPTPSKLNLAQTSTYLRRLLLIYPPFYSHFDLRLSAYEAPGFDTYHLGTIYNLDMFISSLPLEKRITSLTLDWTAVTGLFLFGPLMSRCAGTLEHLSVRGCRKVSIKHHIVPYLVYQDIVEPHSVSTPIPPKRALKSLYVYKARGVRRKPFLIDRKPADGDEPSRYLTTLAEKLGIWTDLGLCPTPKLRCPRRREILRRGKEKYCVPFDKRWRVQDPEASQGNPTLSLLSPYELQQRRKWEEKEGLFTCDNCEAQILDRCEACVYQMTCSSCKKAICHSCAYARPAGPITPAETVPNGAPGVLPPLMAPEGPWPNPTNAGISAMAAMAPQMGMNANGNGPQFQVVLATLIQLDLPAPGAPTNTPLAPAFYQPTVPSAAETNPVVHFLQPCCQTAAPNSADILCGSCMTSIPWAHCDCCGKQICIKHELPGSRRCRGGCEKVFCSSSDAPSAPIGCGDPAEGKAGIKSCLTCGNDVCADCRLDSLHAPPASDDGTESEVEEAALEKCACDCKVCQDNFYCTDCWPKKTTKCETRHTKFDHKVKEIVNHRLIDPAKDINLYLITFEDVLDKKWVTRARIEEDYGSDAHILSAYSPTDPPPPPPTPELTDLTAEPETPQEDEILVGEKEWIMEKILGKAIHPSPLAPTATSSLSPDPTSPAPLPPPPSAAPPPPPDRRQTEIYQIKWLGRSTSEATWEPKSGFAVNSREYVLMESYDIEGPISEHRGERDFGVIGEHCDITTTMSRGPFI
ncbi:hypothetical protein C7212DRAFT_360107 [Tuber magnatum]|uniref:Chromo domain-containing protein n=1 Tax=Tuber magnatum TaxID=42249 RepID=A0A317SGB0_9PEZI|nr:hypothetical protein C7212DRAFT_360107 [Tuber magnatum]